MSPRNIDLRLSDIAKAITAIERHLKRGDLDDELIFDACRARLIEIGEAVKDLDRELVKSDPGVPWREISRMRDQLTHRYFDTQRQIVEDVLANDLEPLQAAVGRLTARIVDADDRQTTLELQDP